MACREPQGFMKSTREKKAQDLERHRGKDEKCPVRKHVREFFSWALKDYVHMKLGPVQKLSC